MNTLVSFRLCTLSDKELIQKVDQATDQMYIDNKLPGRNIPARPNADYDLLVGEVLVRFLSMIENKQEEQQNTFKAGDKVLLKRKTWQSILKHKGYKYFEIEKVIKHSQRINGIGYRIMFPNGEYVVTASDKNLIKVKT